MKKSDLPASIRRFVDEQKTCRVSDLTKVSRSSIRSPFSSVWYRAVACMMLSGRVRPKSSSDGSPNMTDVNRIGKEANFNPYAFERVARTLATADIVVEDWRAGRYREGSEIEAFWDHKEEKLPEIGRRAVLKYIEQHAGYLPKRATPPNRAHLVEFFTLFFACFEGRALAESALPVVLLGFSRMPREDLVQLAGEMDIKAAAIKPDAWSYWIELKDGKVLTEALATAEWMNGEVRDGVLWVYAGEVGRWMVGLDKPLPSYKLSQALEAGPKQTIRAGLGVSRETLVPLFRHCTIKKIGDVCEFRLDRKRMTQEPAGTSPGEELREALKALEPMPAGIAELLATESGLGGEIAIRGCSALLKPENAQGLEAIRRHPSLKNYIEPGGPPGYLLIKPYSEPYTFIERCRALGFTVTMQGSMPVDNRPGWIPDPRRR